MENGKNETQAEKIVSKKFRRTSDGIFSSRSTEIAHGTEGHDHNIFDLFYAN